MRRTAALGGRGSGRLGRNRALKGRGSGGSGRLLRRAGRALRPLGLALALLALIGGLSFLVAFPLWYFSSRSRPAFTMVVGGILAAGLVYLLVRALQRAARRAGGGRELWRQRMLPGLRTAALVLAGLGAAYGLALLAARIFR
jgi:zinc transporter ZupT